MKGSEIKARVKAKGITLREVAARIGESPQNLHGYLNSNDVRSSIIERIAGAIGESVSYFYNEFPVISMEDYDRVKKLEYENRLMRELLDGVIAKKVDKKEKVGTKLK